MSAAVANVAAQTTVAPDGRMPVPVAGRNISMVSGTTFPNGDPFRQRQNEPSIAASTRNPQHLFGAANDYRTVDIPGLPDEVNGDAWLGVFKSFDGGATWQSTLLPGFRQDVSTQGKTSPLYGLEAAADPVVRAGTNGLFYLSGIAFNRESSANGKVFVARYIDNNNLEKGDSIAYLGATVVDVGSSTRFIDKPWLVVDVPRGNLAGNLNDNKAAAVPTCQVPGQSGPLPAGAVYLVYSVFITSPSTTNHDDVANAENHRPGQAMEGRTQIMVSRSNDCGATFTTPVRISDRNAINQGSVAAIDPNTGDIYVAWREFLSSTTPDAIMITKSTNGGLNFSTPVRIAVINPFDQGTSTTSFRTNAFPAMALDAAGRVYVAWAQRGVGPSGDARIVVSTSRDGGATWSVPFAPDNHSRRGHQFMPVLGFGAGKLHLVYWDQRDDKSGIFGQYIDEAPILAYKGDPAKRPMRHTLDIRGVTAFPGDVPTFGPSAKISNYLEGVRAGRTQPEQLQFNAPNLPLFAKGTVPFIGDYLDITVSPAFVANGDGSWRYNTLPTDSPVYFTAWADNRDVRAPRDGNWQHYTPPTFAGFTGQSLFDPTQTVAQCSPGQAGMRDQNVYSARVTTGLVATVLGNNKPLGFVTAADGTRRLIQRTFVVTVANSDPVTKTVVLHIATQPVGGSASFLQFSPLVDLRVNIAPKSSISREVFVMSTDRHASVPISVSDATTQTLAMTVLINPDITNPDITNPDITNPDITNPDITNAEAHAVTVSNPDITNPDITNIALVNPDITNPDITNPDITNPDITNPDIINPDITNPDITNPDITNPDITNPDITNPDITNAALTDVTWDVKNVGNTATSYQVKMLLKQAAQQRLLRAGVKFQLVVTKSAAAPVLASCKVGDAGQNVTVANIVDPSFVDPNNATQFSSVLNPDITNPDITNTTVALAPGDTAHVTLRVFSPVGDTTTDAGGNGNPPPPDPLQDLTGALQDLQHVGVATTSHPVDTVDVNAGSTTPKIEASVPIITTSTLPDGARTLAYSGTISSVGGTDPRTIAIVSGGLPPGLSLAPNTGAIAGTPSQSGTFAFTAQVTDAGGTTATATLAIRIFEPLVVATATLPEGVVNQGYTATLVASGGFPPHTWTLSGGTLPAGVTLSGSGVVGGTPTQSGAFAFTVTANDAAVPGQAASASLTLNVAPTANSQSVTVTEDTATPMTLTANGAPAASFVFSIGNQPAHGTVAVSGSTATYTPALNYNGTDSFTFRATQGALSSSFATVSITVTAVNDPPTATPQTVETPQGVAVNITLTGTDPENDPLTFSIASQPAHGTLSGTPPTVHYTPAAGFTGTDAFTFRANDGSLSSTPGTVTVIVGPPAAGSADVTMTLTDSPDPVALGGTITYTATVHNNGPASATGVSATIAYPSADLRLVSVTPSQGTCAGVQPITCAVGTIASAATATITVTVKAVNHAGTVSASASVSATPLDYNTTNNSSTQTTTITGAVVATTDLSVSQTRDPDPVAVNSNVVYTITVTNNGPSDATGVTLTNTFGSNASFVSASGSQGSCSSGPNQALCSVGSLFGGATATYTLTLKATASGTISNTATVAGNESDPSAANNTSTASAATINRSPTAANDAVTTNEDTAATIAVLSNDTDPDGDALTVTNVGAPAHGTAAINGGATITYAPAADYFGGDSFTYTISDGRGGTSTATVTVTVLSVNDAPSFVKGADQTWRNDATVRTVAGWATAISAGPANESGQALHFIASNDNHTIFGTQPAVDPSGTLTFSFLHGALGSAVVSVALIDDGGTANGGVDSSAAQTFTIAAVANRVPTAGSDAATTNEDTPVTVAVLANDSDADGDTLTVTGTTAPGHGAAVVNPNNTITYTPAADFNGSDSFTYTVDDGHGGTAIGSVTMTVNAVNDPPSFTKGGDQTIAEDAGAQTVPGWASAISPGPTDEAGQALTFLVSNDNGALFSAPPAIAANGTLTYTPANNANGSATVTVRLHDDGGTANGGSDTSAPQAFTITVTAVNDAPSFTKGADQVVAEDSGPQSVPNWATGITAGPADESGQIVSFTTSNDNTALFAAQPTVASDGTLSYASAPNAFGSATVTVQARDDGGTANGGVDTSAPQTFTITVTAINDAPSFAKGTDQTVAEDAGPQTVAGWATSISAGPNESQALTFIVSNDNNGLFSAQPAIASDGTLTFTSAPNAYGVATVTVQLHDDGGTQFGGVDTSAPQTFTITVTAVNDPPVAQPDSAATSTNTPVDINVLANDTDVDNGTGGRVLTSYAFTSNSAGSLNEVVLDPATGRLFAGTALSRIAIINPSAPSATAVLGSIPLSASPASFHRVNPVTGYIYFRVISTIVAVNPATNQVVATIALNNANNFAIDPGNALRSPVLYALQNGRMVVVDINPSSPTSHQAIDSFTLPGTIPFGAVAFNATTNKVYYAATNSVWRFDPAARTTVQVPLTLTGTASDIAVDETRNRIFVASTDPATNVTTVAVIDGAANTVVGTPFTVNGIVNGGSLNKHFAVNQTTGRVYLRTSDVTGNSGWVTAIDASTSPVSTTTIVVGRDSIANVDIVVDEALNKVVTIAERDVKVVIIDGATNTVAANVHLPIGITNGDIELDAAHHRAYVPYLDSLLIVDVAANTASSLGVAAETNGGAVNPITHQFYTATVTGSTNISIFDATGPVGQVGNLPHHDGRYVGGFAFDRNTNKFYTVNQAADLTATSDGEPGFLMEIDATTNQVTASGAVGNAPSLAVVNSQTHQVYVASLGSAGFTAWLGVVTPATGAGAEIDISSLNDVPPAPLVLRTMVVNEAANKVYLAITSGSTAAAAAIDAGNANAITKLPLAGTWGAVRAIAVNRILNRAYFATAAVTGANPQPGRLHIVDGTTNAEIATLDIFSPNTITPQGLAVDQTNGLLYVEDFDNNKVHVVDGTNTLVASLPVCLAPAGIAVNSPARRAYVACGEGAIAFIDGNGPGGSFRVVGRLPVPFQPVNLFVDAAVSRIYATAAITTSQTNAGVLVAVDANGALDGILTVAAADSPTTAGGTTTVNANRTVRYTPPQNFAGTDTFSYTATDGQATSNAALVTVAVSAPPVITTAATLPSGQVGNQYSLQLAATGGSGTLTWSFVTGISGQSLPNGISLSGSGLLTGRPNNSGTNTFTVQVQDQSSPARTTTKVFTLTVTSVSITTATLVNGITETPYSATLAATNGVAPYTWSISSGSLPAGLALDASTGAISGTPPANTVSVTSSFTVRVTDSATTPQTTTRGLSIKIDPKLKITTTTLREAVTLEGYGQTIATVGGVGTKTFAIVSGSLPNGVSFNTSNGTFGGTVTVAHAGAFPITVQVTDTGGGTTPQQTATQAYTINVSGVDQQTYGAQPTNSTSFGGGVRLAQGIQVGVAGALRAVRFPSSALQPSTCPTLTVTIERVSPTSGAPDDTQPLGTVTAAVTGTFQAIQLPTPIAFGVDERFAVVLSAPTANACVITNAPTTDFYLGGAAWTSSGGGWTAATSIADFPIQTLVQNTAIRYFSQFRGFTQSVPFGADSVLMVPGNGSIANNATGTTAELLDGANPDSVLTTGPMAANHGSDFTATTLVCPASTPNCAWKNKVLVVGGNSFANNSSTYLMTAEIWDPASNTWTATGSLTQGRSQHTATVLTCPSATPNCAWEGKVLVAGGFGPTGNNFFSSLSSVELYDPSLGTFSTVASMTSARNAHQATLLPDGRVLVTGGFSSFNATAELYDPSIGNGVWTPTGTMLSPRANHTATLLGDGTVLVAGGVRVNGGTGLATDGEIYTPAPNPTNANPAPGSFSSAGSMVNPRELHTAMRFSDGSVALVGGLRDSLNPSAAPRPSAERYVPGTGFVGDASLQMGRFDYGAALLTDGRLVLSGGNGGINVSQTAGQTLELYATNSSSNGGNPAIRTNLPDGSAGQAYNGSLSGIGGLSPYTYALVSGALPPGLAVNGSAITGTPTVSGTYQFALRITDSQNPAHSSTSTLRIRIDALDITTTTVTKGYVNRAYTFALAATGIGAKTWTITSGTLPVGLSLNTSTGAITGTPTSTAFNNFTVKAVDAAGQTAFAALFLEVDQPLVITTTSLDVGNVTWGYGACVNTNFGHFPFTWSVTAGQAGLDAVGLTLNMSGCLNAPLTGLKATGQYPFTVQVSDSDVPPQVLTQSLSIHVGANDQNMGGFDANGATVAIGSGNVVAQTFRQSLTGNLIAVWAPVACSSAPPGTLLTLEIRAVDGLGRPLDSTRILSTNTYDVNTLTPFTSGVFQRTFTLQNPVFAPFDVHLAAVFRTASGQCTIVKEFAGGDYPYGDAYVGDGTTWTALRQSDATHPDLPISTTVDPTAALDFMVNGPRGNHTATPVAGNKVLLAGGAFWGSTAQLYTRATHQFAPTSHEMTVRRQFHTATLLPNGTVLFVGGQNMSTGQALASAEIYDPTSDTFSATGNLAAARWYHTATLLADGRVLVAGGDSDWSTQLSSTEIYDPSTGLFTAGPAMHASRAEHTATLIPSGPHAGEVLIVGGYGFSPNGINAERWVPNGGSGSFVATTGQPALFHASHVAAFVPATQQNPARVVIAAGWSGGLSTATEHYFPSSDTFAPGGALAYGVQRPAAATLANGNILLAGGQNDSGESEGRLQILDVNSFNATSANTMAVRRSALTATRLDDGTVLVAGGFGPSNASSNSGERFDPAQPIVGFADAVLPDRLTASDLGPITLNGFGAPTNSTYTFAIVNAGKHLPPGMSFDAGTGTLSGQPTASGQYFLPFTVSFNGAGTTQALQLWVDPLRITTTSLSGGIVHHPYSDQMQAVSSTPQTWTIVSGSLPAGLSMNSAGAISGTPTQSGFFNIQFQVQDQIGQVAAKSLAINIQPDSPPIANGQNVTTNEDTAKAITLTGFDPDGFAVTYAIVDQPGHGMLSGTAPNVTYTPAANFNGADAFTFKVNDGNLDSGPAIVNITINAVNDPPVAASQSVVTNEDTPKAITLSASDVDSPVLTFAIVTAPQHGTLTGTPPSVTYTPAANYNGDDSFTFKANDGSLDSNVATVTVSVTPVNDPPVIVIPAGAWFSTSTASLRPSGIQTERRPLSMAIGDFNNDGKLDLVTANQASNDVSVLLGNGNGTFQTALSSPTGFGSFAVAAGDFNGDGKLDLAVSDTNLLKILIGNGNGTFQAPVAGPAGGQQIVVADFNHDGKLDLAAVWYFGVLRVMLGNGNGTFQNAITYSIGYGATGLAVADFNGDGIPDIVTANRGDSPVTNTLSVLLGVGNGTFSAMPDVAVSSGPYAVVAGDFNGDGRVDLVVGNQFSNDLALLLGNGNGTFQAPSYMAAGNTPLALGIGDLNFDGNLDLVVGNTNSHDVYAFPGNGNGTFSAPTVFAINAASVPRAVAVGDFSGDTHPDVVVANQSTDDVVLFTNAITAYTEGGPAIVVSSDATVSDIDSADFDTGTLTVDFAANGTVDDRLGVRNEGSGPGQIGASAGFLTFGAVPIGSFVGGTGTTPLVVTFNANATPAVVQAVVRNVTFANVSANPSTAPRTVRFVVTDGDGGTSNAATKTISVIGVNSPPVANSQNVTTNEDTAKAITLTGVDPEGSAVTYAIVDQPGHGTLSGTAPNVTYTPAANYNGSDSFTFKVNDGSLDSALAAVSITINAVNDPPVANADGWTVHQNTASDFHLVGLWPFNEGGGATARDLSGHGNDGTLNGPQVTTNAPSGAGFALQFDGASQYIDVPDASSLHPTTEITLAAWVYLTSPGAGTEGVISKPHGAGGTGWALRVENGGADFGLNNGIVNCSIGAGPNTLPLGTWAHIAATFHAAASGFGRAKVYMNGSLMADNTSCITGSLLNTADSLQIGREFANGRYFAGLIDDARVYDRVLTDTEVAGLSQDFPMFIAAPGVLANDTDVDSVITGAVLNTAPAHGTVQLNADGSFSYAPAAGFSGADTFTYRASDGQALSAPATVTITVQAFTTAVEVDISSLLNADVVINNGNGGTDTAQNAIDGSGYVLMTQSYATAVLGASGNGLPDNGFFAADGNHPDVQLYATNTNNGFNARLSLAAETYSFYTPNRQYSQLQLFATATEGNASVTATLHYTDGTTDVRSLSVPDWFNDPPPAGMFYLIDGLDRQSINDFIVQNSNDPAIFGMNLNPNSGKVLVSVDLTKAASSQRFVLFAVTAQ